MEKAGMEIEQHLASGGSLDPLMESINKAVNESGFFGALSQSQEKGNAASTETSGRKNGITVCESIRELIYEVYLPGALQIRVDYGLFWRLTPKKLEPFLKAYESKRKRRLESISQAGSMGCTQVTAWGRPSGKTCRTLRNRFRSSDRRRRYRKTLTGKPNISAPMQLCSINSSKKKEEPHHAAM
ncbi:MAG: hypothetical protein V8R50_00045 [Clostridia bacterium]